jgi:RNA methyltransferase, TrmH family
VIYGTAATKELLRIRPHDVERILFDRNSHSQAVKDILELAKKARISVQAESEEKLSHIAHSKQHQGLVALCRTKQRLSEEELFKRLNAHLAPLIFLDGVDNPHNIGAIIRSSVHFGLPYILGKKDYLPASSGSLIRTASGGFEHIDIVECEDEVRTLLRLKKFGYRIFALSAHSKNSLFEQRFDAPCLFVFGSERDGIGVDVARCTDLELNIPGTSKVESLNVAVSTGITLAFWYSTQRIINRP